MKQTAGTLPPGLSFTDKGDGTAKISGTPTAAAAAPGKTQQYSLTVKAETAAGNATQTLSLKVTNPGVAAEITSGNAASLHDRRRRQLHDHLHRRPDRGADPDRRRCLRG